MCLIFLKERDKPKLTAEWLEQIHNRNNDGWGLTFIDSIGVNVIKGFGSRDLIEAMDSVQRMDVDILGHVRMATQGEITLANNHPYAIGNTGIYLMHNGIVTYPSKEEDKVGRWPDGGYSGMGCDYRSWYLGEDSDTKLLVNRFLSPLLSRMADPSDFIRSKEFDWMMEEICGRGNKFALTDKHGHVLVNKEDWQTTTKGVYVSNTSSFSIDRPEYSYSAAGVH